MLNSLFKMGAYCSFVAQFFIFIPTKSLKMHRNKRKHEKKMWSGDAQVSIYTFSLRNL